MKFKIAGKAGKREVREPVVTLDFVDNKYGEITIVAVEVNGDRIAGSELCTFKNNGKIFMHTNVNPDLGFCLNGRGEIKLDIIDIKKIRFTVFQPRIKKKPDVSYNKVY